MLIDDRSRDPSLMARSHKVGMEQDDLGPGIYLMPSAMEFMDFALVAARCSADVRVVGDGLFFRRVGRDPAAEPVLSPAACLKAGVLGDRSTVLVFTDQLVSAEFANVLVQRKARLEFFSAFEQVASIRFALPVIQVLGPAGRGPVTAGGARDSSGVLAELARYLDFCADLGDAWLAAPLQESRLPAHRTAAAHRRLRVYASIAMSSCIDAGDHDAVPDMLRPIFDARNALSRRVGDVRNAG